MKKDSSHDLGVTPFPAETFWAEADGLALLLAAQLEYFENLGTKSLPADIFSSAPEKEAPKAPDTEPKQALPQAPFSAGDSKPSPPAALSPAAVQKSDAPSLWAPAAKGLAELSRLCSQCTACTLAETRPAAPFIGQGPARPLLVVVGPTPEMFDPDRAALLSSILEKGLELNPEDYYATSLLKCVPPEDQTLPRACDECCWPILKRQLELLAPEVILILGKKPAQQITGRHGEPFGLLRPITHSLPGLKAFIRITYGLEDIMSDPKLKNAAWQDLKKVKMGLAKIKKETKEKG